MKKEKMIDGMNAITVSLTAFISMQANDITYRQGAISASPDTVLRAFPPTKAASSANYSLASIQTTASSA